VNVEFLADVVIVLVLGGIFVAGYVLGCVVGGRRVTRALKRQFRLANRQN
jgi:hypothetical protein